MLLLAGVTLNSFFSALILFVQYLADFAEALRAMRWLMGDLDVGELQPDRRRAAAHRRRVRRVRDAAAHAEPAERRRRSRRRHAAWTSCRAQRLAFLSASLATGAAVSLGGPIGFIGIIVPHLVRLMVGSDHRIVLPASALFGAAFLVLCDLAARTVMAPLEIPVGVVTAMIGGPFFLWLLVKKIMSKNSPRRSRSVTTLVQAASVLRASSCSSWLRRRAQAAAEAHHLARPERHRDAVRDRRRPAGGRRQHLRRLSARGARAADGRRAASIPTPSASSRCRPDLVVTYGSQADLQTQLKRASIPFFDYRHGGLDHIMVTMRALGQRDRARRAGGEGRARRSRPAIDARQEARRRASRGRARCWCSAASRVAAQHLRQRRHAASSTTCSTPPAARTC